MRNRLAEYWQDLSVSELLELHEEAVIDEMDAWDSGTSKAIKRHLARQHAIEMVLEIRQHRLEMLEAENLMLQARLTLVSTPGGGEQETT
jgi:hypothetical protein